MGHIHSSRKTKPQSIMFLVELRKCPFCPFNSKAKSNPQCMVYRHIKVEAEKDPEDRAGHPAKDSAEFTQIMIKFGCFRHAKTTEEKEERRANVQRKYTRKAKLLAEKNLYLKVQDAFRALEYVSLGLIS